MATEEKKSPFSKQVQFGILPLSPPADSMQYTESIKAPITKAQTLGLHIQPDLGKALKQIPEPAGYCLVFDRKNKEFGYELRINGIGDSIIIIDSGEEPESYVKFKERYDRVYGDIDKCINIEEILKRLEQDNNSNIFEECDRIANQTNEDDQDGNKAQDKARKTMLKYLLTKQDLRQNDNQYLNDTQKMELKRGLNLLQKNYFDKIMHKIDKMKKENDNNDEHKDDDDEKDEHKDNDNGDDVLDDNDEDKDDDDDEKDEHKDDDNDDVDEDNYEYKDEVDIKMNGLSNKSQIEIYNRMLMGIRHQERNLLKNFKSANIEYYIKKSNDELEKYIYVIIGCSIDVAEMWAAAPPGIDVPIDPKEAVKLGKMKKGIHFN